MNVQLHLGDCLDYMRSMPDKSVDAVITDPPYGINKEGWDSSFPDYLITEGFRLSDFMAVIPGIWSLGRYISLMEDKYLWTIAGHKGGAMSNGAVGFNKWQPVVVGGKTKKRIGSDAFDFSPSDIGHVIYHSCQKPLEFMKWVISKTTSEGDTILDPFMGSGTTGVACVQTGRNFIGVEIDPTYYKIAEKRIAEAQLQLRLPLEAEIERLTAHSDIERQDDKWIPEVK